jgi:hypothetical protein
VGLALQTPVGDRGVDKHRVVSIELAQINLQPFSRDKALGRRQYTCVENRRMLRSLGL